MTDLAGASNKSETSDQQAVWWNNQIALKTEFETYQTVRKRIQTWHPDIYKRVSRAEMDYVGKKLRMLVGNTFCFDGEEHSAIFMDYLITFSCPNGTTAIERFLKSVDRSKEDDTDRMAYEALAGVRYTMLQPVEARSGFGVLCEDLFLGQRVFLMDCGLSQAPTDGLVIATAVYPVRKWFMTTGAALPLPDEEISDTITDLFEAAGLRFSQPVRLSKKDVSRLVLTAVQVFMASGGLDHVQYR